MPRDLFAEIGDSPKPASNTSTGRDLFAELDAAPPAKKPGLVERAGDFVTSTLGGVSQTMLDNASSGTFRRDAAQEDGVLDRLGSLVERGGAAVDQGLYNFISATTGSKEAARRAKILEEGTTGQEVAGQTRFDDVTGLGSYGAFVLDSAAESLPGMVTAAAPVAGLPILGTSITGDLAQERAQNDGREDATGSDVLKAAPFGYGSAALERLGVKIAGGAAGKMLGKATTSRIGQAATSTAARRIGTAAAGEAATEYAQGMVESAGGTLGTEKGFDIAEANRQGIEGAAAGFGIGGALRGGREIVDGAGRLRSRKPDDNRRAAPGKVETALEANAVPTQADIESPLDTGDIAAGRAGIAVAQAENEVSREFEALGLPEVGASVLVNDPETGTARGTLIDRFTAEDGTGVVIELEDGTKLREYDDVLADVGVTITPADPLAEADAIDARLAARAEAALQDPSGGEGSSSPLSPPEGAPPSPTSDTAPAPSGPVSDGGAIVRSIFGDKARITSGYRGPNHPLSKKNPNSWHAKSRAAVDMAPIPGMSFAEAKAAIEAQGFTLIEAINEVGKGRTKHATGDHWHFVIGGGGGAAPATGNAPAQGGGLGMGRAREDAPTVEDSDKVGPEPLAMPEPTREPIATRGREPDAQPDPADRDTAVTVTGREIGVEYRLAELDDLTASNTPDGAVNPNYPKERQPRDRSRAASLSQVENIAGNLNPRLLGRSPKAADGAPIVSPDGVVESGNGRTLALQKVYEGNADRAAAYRQFLEAEGFNTEGMNKPVLVRVRDGNLAEEDVQAFVREANARDTAGMSGTETAASDADALPGGLLDLFRGGDIDAAGNRDFVRGFMQALVPENDRANLVLKDGSIAGTLVKRIEAALLVRAIGPRAFIEKLVDADGDNIKAIGKALVDVSGPLAKLREAVRSGAVDASMDIADNIAEAVEIVERARREKRNVSDLINQRDVFSGEAVAPLTEAVLHLFFNGPRFSRPAGRERIAQRLGFYIEQAEKAAPGGGLFGESTKAQPGDILGLANEKDRAPSDGDQADLLAARPGESERDGRDGADVRADGRDVTEQRGEGALPQSGEQGASEDLTVSGDDAPRNEGGVERDYPPRDEASPSTDTGQRSIAANPSSAPDIRGDEARKGWRYFTGASGSLGVPRSDMPQVRSEHRGALVNFLKGRGVQHAEETVPAATLMPTQAEFSPSKVAKAKAFTGGNRAILASAEGYVVDGHHQWMAARDQNEEIRIIRLDAPIRDLLTMVKEFPSVEGEDGKPASQDAPPEPVTTAYTLSTSKSGKGLELRGASDAQVAAIKAAGVPIPPAKKDGTLVFSKKREADVRSALASIDQAGDQTAPAEAESRREPPQKGADQEPRDRPSEAELSRRDWTSMFNAAGERMRERLDAVDSSRLRPMLEAMAEGRPIVGDGDVIETINPHRAYELGYIKLHVAEDGRRSFSITDTGRDFLAGKKTVEGKGQIGENANGEPVFEDENGVRSVVETIDGVRIRLTESVGIVPGRGTYVDVSRRWDRYKTTSELAERRAQVEQEAKQLVARAAAAKRTLDGLLANAPGEYKPGPLKTVERIVEKVVNEYYPSASDIKDVARGALIVDTMEEAEAAIARVLELNVVEDKGWKPLNTFYVDRKIIVDLAGIKTEVQIVPRAVWDAAKKGGARALYKESRQPDVTRERKDELIQQQRDIYASSLAGSAFEGLVSDAKSAAGYSASASSRESGTPGLAYSPGAEPQDPSSAQTSAEGAGSSNVATNRPSTSLNDGNVSISDDVSADDGARKGVNPSKNRLVSDERAAELRARLREKLNPNRLNAGIDPELLAIGTELAVYHIEKGARRFTALSRAIAADIGVELESVRKYLRGWYNGARDMMEDSGESVAGMDDADEVGRAMRTFADWANAETARSPAAEPSDLQSIFADALLTRGFDSITDARKFAKEATGKEYKPGTLDAKKLDEAIEAAVVLSARAVVAEGTDPLSTYRQLVSLYGRQPNLAVRTSTSVEQQAYSTPAPLAYLAALRSGIDDRTAVYEPSAGNGMLLLTANPSNITANELNADRAARLRSLYPQANITQYDAMEYNPDAPQDAIIANPPFGPVKDAHGDTIIFDMGQGYETREIDHAIAMSSLRSMKDGGRAALIVGSVAKTAKNREDAYNSKAKREFYYRLYSEYNVTDHFTVSGDLYKKQGAAWPVDVIVIEGRGKSSLPLPAVKAPPVFNSWEALETALVEPEQVRGEAGSADSAASLAGERSNASDERDSGGGDRGRLATGRGSGADVEPDAIRQRPTSGEPGRDGLDPREGGSRSVAEASRQVREPGRNRQRVPAQPALEEGAAQPAQVKYVPASGSYSLDTLVPFNMQTSLQNALDRIEQRHGSIDLYVADRLGFTRDEMGKRLSAEATDAIGLALDNMDRGAAFIIGDQTGIGKGRVVASVLRYAMRENRPAIFVTEKPNLYADIYRDMVDVGIPEMLGRDPVMLMTNASQKVPLGNGKELKSPTAATHNKRLERAARGEETFDLLMTTYSQMQTVKGKETPRQRVLEALADGAIIVFDESHNAGGQGPNERRDKKAEKGEVALNRAEFSRMLARKAHGVMFSSATYAKRPEVMDLYARTDMGLAVSDPQKLGEVISKGGVPMQQVIASALSDAGQYVRRERTWEGVEYRTPRVPVDAKVYGSVTEILSGIREFEDRYIVDTKDRIDKEARAEAKSISPDGSVGGAGVSSTNFTSVMHNIIEQMLLSLKAGPAADRALEAIAAGRKPVITMANTMGSFIQEYADDNSLRAGDPIDLDFGAVFDRYLDRTRHYVVRRPFSKEKGEKKYISDTELGPDGLAEFKRVSRLIRETDFGGLPISPIDHIIQRLKDEGYSVGEITGRQYAIDYGGGAPTLALRGTKETGIAGRLAAVNGFNSGKLDAMILNQSGSTGLSIHASDQFKDQRPRTMIIAQAERNVDTHMQMLGRVHRTGQVVLPEYDQLVAEVPAEMRPAAVLAKKMASLNANTTGARGSAVTAEDIPDFMNEFGDEIAARIMEEDRDLSRALGDPLKTAANSGGSLEREGAARKVTGRLMLLSLDQQQEFYDSFIDQYLSYLQQKEAAGEAALEAKTLPLDAKVLDTRVVAAATRTGTPFGEAVVQETVDVKRLGKPMSSEQVLERIAETIGGEVESLDAMQRRGAQWMVSEIRQPALAEFGVYEREAVDNASENAAVGIADRLRANRQSFERLTGLLVPGKAIMLYNENGDAMGGVVIAMEKKGRAKNPLALSTWHVTVAMADASRQLTIPLSRLRTAAMNEEDGALVESTHRIEGLPPLEAFDNMQTEAREHRTMFTGNMLAAYNETGGKGQVVNFVGEDGSVRSGILMRRGYDHAKSTARRPVEFRTVEQVMRWIERGKVAMGNGAQVALLDGGITVSAPASKRAGGHIYLNRDIRDALGTDFVKKSNGMEATAPTSRAREVIAALMRSSANLQAKTDLDEARRLVADEGTKDSIPEDDLFSPAQPERSMTQRQRAELEARQQQGMARRGGQQGLGDQDGGLFSSERDQGSLFSRTADLPVVSIRAADWGKLPKEGRGRLEILRGRAKQWYAGLVGSTVTSSDGKTVTFNKTGAKRSIRAGEDLLSLTRAIPAVIERGELVSSVPSTRPGMRMLHSYAARVRDENGKTVPVVVTVREAADGSFQYSLHGYQEPGDASAKADGEAVKAFTPALEGSAPSGINLFILPGEGNSTAETSVDLTALREQLAALGLRDKVAMRVVDTLGGVSAGRFTPGQQRLIEIATDTRQDEAFTLNHEALHALRDMGLFKDSEWKILVARAKREPGLMRSIKRRYAKLDAEGQAEESVADLFAMFQRGDFEARGVVAKAFKMLRDVLEAIGNAFRGRGLRTAEGVMRDMASGRVAARAGSTNEPGAIKASIPETAEALAQAGTGPTWKEKMGDTFDRWRTAMQDRYLPLLRVQQAIEAQTGKSLPEDMNPYVGEELMSGRIGSRLETLMEDNVRPLFDAMADEEITTDELETYLYARHAPERNARIAEINPEFNGENGSGMSNLEARAVMARIQRDGKMEAMERLAERVDRMRDMALDYRVETGLMSQEDADAWRATYEYYVPLRGFKEVEGDPASAERINRSGGGINVRGKESRAAYGRRSQADSPLAYTILQAEEAIVRGETNRTAQRFINLAKANPDEGFWEVNKVSGRRQMNPETGLVEEYLVHQLTAEDKDWTVSAKFDGKEVRVTMNRSNPTARRVADSMRNLTQHQLDWVTEHLGKLNRFLSRVNTSYNPEFVISNAMRDIQTAAVNLTGIERDGLVKGTLKDYPAALKAATKGAFRKGEGEWKRWYDEFVGEGGRVYFNQVEDIGLIKKRIEREAQLAGADKPGTKKAQAALHAKRLFFAAGDLIENMNLGVENAVRLAAYKNGRELGMSKQAAASMAKNLTVNFNRRGTMGPAMNAAYLFYNASVQGTVRLITALRSKKARRLMYGVVAGGAAVEMLNAMVTGYDDDEESYYDKIPHYEKERNLIVMMPGTNQYVKIPLPYGYNVFWEGGRTTAEIARRGGEGWKDSAFNLFLTAANSFNPVGGADSLINLVAPTIMDPIVDLELNQDFTGAPIMPEQNPFDSPDPDHNRYFSSVEPHWREIAHGLNKLSGGDDVVPGSVSVSPETLEYLFGYAVGGAGRFVERMGSLPVRIADPDHETSVNDFPFARKLVSQTSPWLDKGLYYDRIGQIDQTVDYTKDYLEREQFEQAAGFAERNAQILGLEPVMKAAQKEMRKIRKARRANDGAYELGKIDEAAYRAEKQVIDQAETMVITGFNTQWNRSVGYGRDRAGER